MAPNSIQLSEGGRSETAFAIPWSGRRSIRHRAQREACNWRSPESDSEAGGWKIALTRLRWTRASEMLSGNACFLLIFPRRLAPLWRSSGDLSANGRRLRADAASIWPGQGLLRWKPGLLVEIGSRPAQLAAVFGRPLSRCTSAVLNHSTNCAAALLARRVVRDAEAHTTENRRPTDRALGRDAGRQLRLGDGVGGLDRIRNPRHRVERTKPDRQRLHFVAFGAGGPPGGMVLINSTIMLIA